jgi:hypothetical protein
MFYLISTDYNNLLRVLKKLVHRRHKDVLFLNFQFKWYEIHPIPLIQMEDTVSLVTAPLTNMSKTGIRQREILFVKVYFRYSAIFSCSSTYKYEPTCFYSIRMEIAWPLGQETSDRI